MNDRKALSSVCLAFALLACASGPRAQTPGPGAKPATAMPDEIPAGAGAKSDAYFEGGYWLILWDFLYGAVMYLLLLHFRWSAKMRNFAERIARFKPLQTLIYWMEFLIVTTILGAPLAIYEGYFRERQYGLATQTLGPWMVEQFEMLLVNMVIGGIEIG